MWAIFEVFFDTIIVCTLTAFVLLSSSSDAIPQTKVFSNITTDSQTFSIAGHISDDEDVPLVDKEYNSLVIDVDSDGVAKLYTEQPAEGEYVELKAYGNTYYAKAVNEKDTTEDDYVYTNIMSIEGNAAKDSAGKTVKDENGKTVIDSVKVS